jgi:hypothetical protein
MPNSKASGAEREGSFVGGTSLWDYGRLCELLDRLGFLGFDENYAAPWTDDETVVVEVSDASGVHRVLDYGHQGPPELMALQLAIDAIAERVEWGMTNTTAMAASSSEGPPNGPTD